MLSGFDLVINTAIVQIPEINDRKRLGYEVNVLGIQNLCEAVQSTDSIKGFLHAGSWHVFGETGLRGRLSEEFGYHPDRIEKRAKLYALSKIAQEAIVQIVSAASAKSYGIIRLGTVLGETMPKLTAANIFIENALNGEPMTPYRHTQYRPMLYVDVEDVCRAFESFATLVLDGTSERGTAKILNLVSSKPVTIIELARIVQASFIRLTRGKITPRISVIDKGEKPLYSPKDKTLFRVDNTEARQFLGLAKLAEPRESVERIVKTRLNVLGYCSSQSE
jgi:nucleoside-diphosphate-sugar epimerase